MKKLKLIAGPCVIESESQTIYLAERLKDIAERLGLDLYFKASYDKANRSSYLGFRGVGIDDGLEILYKVKVGLDLKIITDVHCSADMNYVKQVVDVIQIPALLCRQTDLLIAAAKTGRIVNVKKGQFMSPYDMENVANKLWSGRCEDIWLTERGTTFGYNNLVVDMRSLVIMRGFGYPVIFDASHSVQLPSSNGDSSGGQRQFIEPLLKAAIAIGIDGMFLEVAKNPSEAFCDGSNSIAIDELEEMLKRVL